MVNILHRIPAHTPLCTEMGVCLFSEKMAKAKPP